VNKIGPVVSWKIRCLNKQTRSFSDRLLLLDTSKVSEQQRDTILRMAERAPYHRGVLRYRSSFVDVEEGRADGVAAKADILTRFFVPDYFEDEQGNPMGPVEVMQALSGDPYPIMPGYPLSVLRLGAVRIRAKDEWCREKANVIGRFLQIVERITDSDWLGRPLRLKSTLYKGRAEPVLELVHPGPEATTRVCLWIRQLYSRDKALERACQAYAEHVDDERKRWWVQDRVEGFKKFLDRKPGFFALPAWTARRLLDVFIYGLGLPHPRSKKKVEEQLAELVATHGRERVVMAFNCCCRELCQYAFDLHPVIKQDFDHWVKTEGCVGADWPRIEDLLGPYGAARR
jgi:hypothetical protein